MLPANYNGQTLYSAGFDAAMRAGGEVFARVEVMRGSQVIGSSDVELSILAEGSNVTIDITSRVLRSCSLNILVKPGDTVFTSDLIGPMSGNELRVWRGLKVNGVAEYIPLGLFNCYSMDKQKNEDGILTIYWRGQDRAGLVVSKSRRVNPYTVNSGTATFTAIGNIINSFMIQPALGTVQKFNLASNNPNTPRLVFNEDEDMWAKCLELAKGAGNNLYFDAFGNLFMANMPSPTTQAPVQTYDTGPNGVFVMPFTETVDLDEFYNGVIVRGSAPWLITPVYGEAWDYNSNSPTYRYGPLGERPYVIDNPIVTSGAAATTMAQKELNKHIGVPSKVVFSTLVDPRMEPWDVIQVTEEDLAVNSKYVIDRLEIPLSYKEPMTFNGRKMAN